MTPPASHRRLPVELLCAFVVSAAVWITWPVVELGADDDWSYVKTTFDLARTGHIHYNGWATIMLGALAYWGAAITKLFGPSFTAVRLSVLPVAAACAAMLARIARRSNLSLAWTILLTLTVTLSPVFIFCATNFSSDIPGFLSILLCADLAATTVCTLDRRRRRKLALLAAIAVIGFIGGTIRQTVWGMPIVCLLYVAWRKRHERPILIASIAWLLALAAGITFCQNWYRNQPYALPEYFGETLHAWINTLPGSLMPLITLSLTAAMFLLPITFAALPAIRPSRWWKTTLILLAVCLPVPLIGLRAVGPWMGNTVTAYGIDHDLDAIGGNPEILPLWLCLILTFCSLASLATWACAVFFPVKLPPRERRAPEPPLPYAHHVRIVLTLYAIGYIALILMRSATGGMFDRYLIPLLAVFGLWAAAYVEAIQRRTGKPIITRWAWAMLGVLAYFSLANTHDYFAAARARVAAATAIENRGIPRTRITAGMAYDAWTQLQITGYVNDARIVNPPDAFASHPRSIMPGKTDFWFWEWTPAVAPRFFVVNTPQPDLRPTDIGPFPYTAWLPPFTRTVYVGEKLE